MSKGVGQMEEANKTAKDYLRAPYSRVLVPDDETGTYTAKIAEFPGCVAQGESPEEAYRNLEAAAESWIDELLGMGQQVPEPGIDNRYSGRVALRLPKSLHRNAARLADREGTSLNQLIVAAVAEWVGANTLYAQMTQSLEQQVAEAAVRSMQAVVESAIGEAGAQPYLHWVIPSGAVTPMRTQLMSPHELGIGENIIWRDLETHGARE